jgi:predicted nucleic acid-binding Zn ribbon protein
VENLVTERGWDDAVAVGSVIGRWDAVVGAHLAGHCIPVSFVDGALTVRADSTAWATQVRLLVPQLLARLAEAVGDGVVTSIVVHGPTAPSWRRGAWQASGGQGPRDTYG